MSDLRLTDQPDEFADIENSLRGMSLKQRGYHLRDQLRSMDMSNLSGSQANKLLAYLWIVFREKSWGVPFENGQHYNDFRMWVDNEIAPTFKKQTASGELAPPLMADVVRIVERTLKYADEHEVMDSDERQITPQRLIEEGGFGKLKITSSQFKYTARTELRDKILIDIIEKTASEIRTLYSKPRIPPIHYSLNVNDKGTFDIIIMDLSISQVNQLRTALKNKSVEHPFELSSADREVLLTLLEPEAREQEESDSASD